MHFCTILAEINRTTLANCTDMTDVQIVAGIKKNDDKTWRFIYRSMRKPFFSTVAKTPESSILSSNEIEDIFQDACILLMDAVKNDRFRIMDGSHIFNWLVTTGRFRIMNMVRAAKSKSSAAPGKDCDTPDIINIYEPKQTASEENGPDVTAIQTEQDRFLDRAFAAIPETCRSILKRFYWDKMPMDEIASLVGLKNADTAKATKNRCMNRFKDIACKMLEDEEFAEATIRSAAERSALRDLLREEQELLDEEIAALTLEFPEGNDDPWI